MPFTTHVVPMPAWSTPVGCTKLVLALVILAFVAACTAIWGAYPAFGISIFTASLNLLVFAYYLVSLSFQPKLYNKWVVLLLESVLTLFWMVTLILLAGWTDASAYSSRFIWSTPLYYDAENVDVGISKRSRISESLKLCSSPLDNMKRDNSILSSTPTRLHGQDAHGAARVLAGLSAGLAGLICAFYIATLIVFVLNFNKPATEPTVPSDVEATAVPDVTVPHTPVNTTAIDQDFQPGTAKPPAVTAPLRVNTLPKDFEPKEQLQAHYLTPEQAAEAGIQPPTPILKAQMAEKRRSDGEVSEDEQTTLVVPMASGALPEISPVSSLGIER